MASRQQTPDEFMRQRRLSQPPASQTPASQTQIDAFMQRQPLTAEPPLSTPPTDVTATLRWPPPGAGRLPVPTDEPLTVAQSTQPVGSFEEAAQSAATIRGPLTSKEKSRSAVLANQKEIERAAQAAGEKVRSAALTTEEYLPPILGTLGGAGALPPGGIPGAWIWGTVGAALQGGFRAARADHRAPTTYKEAFASTALAGTWEGVMEGVGRGLSMFGTAFFRGTGDAAGTTIKGTKLPETMGELWGKTDGLIRKFESYLGSSWLGAPLRLLRRNQDEAARKIMADLSKVPNANARLLAANWDAARELTRAQARPIYQLLGDMPSPETVLRAASDILNDSSLRLTSRARTALQNAVSGGSDAQIAKSLGYNSAEDAMNAMGAKTFNSVRDSVQKDLGGGATLEGMFQARHELGEIAFRSADPNDRRLAYSAWESLDNAINKVLTPQQVGLKAEADHLWRRSYIMDEVHETLLSMELGQIGGASIDTQAFSKFINGLAYERATTTELGAAVVARKASKLEVLFDSPADRAAIRELAVFLKTKAANIATREGLGQSLANIGTVLAAASIPMTIVRGMIKTAMQTAGSLGLMYGFSWVLARPGGARMLLRYFKAPGASGTAILTRFIAESEREDVVSGATGAIESALGGATGAIESALGETPSQSPQPSQPPLNPDAFMQQQQ